MTAASSHWDNREQKIFIELLVEKKKRSWYNILPPKREKPMYGEYCHA